MSLAHLTAPGSGADTTTWPGAVLRRPAAYVDQPTQPLMPPATRPAPAPAPAVVVTVDGWEWDLLDLLLLPLALYLAGRPDPVIGRHRRPADQAVREHAGRVIRSHRQGSR